MQYLYSSEIQYNTIQYLVEYSTLQYDTLRTVKVKGRKETREYCVLVGVAYTKQAWPK